MSFWGIPFTPTLQIFAVNMEQQHAHCRMSDHFSISSTSRFLVPSPQEDYIKVFNPRYLEPLHGSEWPCWRCCTCRSVQATISDPCVSKTLTSMFQSTKHTGSITTATTNGQFYRLEFQRHRRYSRALRCRSSPTYTWGVSASCRT